MKNNSDQVVTEPRTNTAPRTNTVRIRMIKI